MKNPFKDPQYETEQEWRRAVIFLLIITLLPLITIAISAAVR